VDLISPIRTFCYPWFDKGVTVKESMYMQWLIALHVATYVAQQMSLAVAKILCSGKRYLRPCAIANLCPEELKRRQGADG